MESYIKNSSAVGVKSLLIFNDDFMGLIFFCAIKLAEKPAYRMAGSCTHGTTLFLHKLILIISGMVCLKN